ncbi:hypothetical protein D9N16_10130 [Lactococcus raffinolactis]|nr:hypothetical protein [Lactococcus raffinolactis]TLQ11066.1 hypothetical protein FEZ46_11800 [Lactococcus raffinolactis]
MIFKLRNRTENRKSLLKQVKSGEMRKVLVKQDIPIETDHSLEQLVDDLLKRFDELLPFYKETKK